MKKSVRTLMTIAVALVLIVASMPAGTVMGARVTGNDDVVPTVQDREETTPAAEAAPARPEARRPDTRRTKVRETRPIPAGAQAPATPVEAAPAPEATATQKVEKTTVDSQYVTIDFEDVDIRVFIKFISELTGKNFVIDRNVKGTVTIISPRKISVDEAYKVFESVLDVHDYTAVPAGDIIKIIPVRTAKEKNVETLLREQARSSEDKVVTQLIPLKYADPEEMKKVLIPLVSKESVILSYSATGMLIITDLLSNVKRLLTIVDALDAEGIEEQIAVIPLKYADAVEISKSLTSIFQQGRQPKRGAAEPTVRVVPDERTNTIITLASENDTNKIKQLIELLDREVPRGEAKIRVYHLENADAEELTKVLMDIPTGDDAKRAAQGGQAAPLLSKEVKVVPDKATNTLIITAGRDDYTVLEEVIKELDVPRPMVYIEALIMEVNVDKDMRIGAEWVGGERFHSDSNKVYGGGFTLPSGSSIMPGVDSTGLLSYPAGFSVGVFGESIKIGDITFPSLGAVFNAYREDSDVHILSTPQVLTLDNQEAEIYVGENVPYQTRQETSTTDRDYSTYEYKDVGVTLRLTPQISQERFVRLDIYQEVTKLKSQVEDRPTTLKRTAKTAVTIKDKYTVVVGGLIGDDINNTVYKIPLLGDIPYLGYLFKYDSSTREKRNLFIFITPHIIENPVEASDLYEKKQGMIDSMEEGVIKRHTRDKSSAEGIRIED
ncbi:MAG: type II secretion system secretin GspD [Deltaproteobacteria bacterium]|nr:type II secretion system secretin GspD [Deltaproteobacteria bacterium]